MPVCPYCGTEIAEQYNFCISCESQIKCLHCAMLLLPNKSRCLRCGTQLESANSNSPLVNRFTFEERHTTKSSYRKIEGQFTDNAFGQATSLFGGLPQARPKPLRSVAPQQSWIASPVQQPLFANPEADGNIVSDQLVDVPGDEEQSGSLLRVDTVKDKALRYFDLDGEHDLVARISDFKGNNKQEQQKRFMILYVWAYQQIFSKPVSSKKDVLAATTKKGIFDTNCYRHFDDIESKFFSKGEAGYKISLDGEKEVSRILTEVEDESMKGFQDWNKVRPREKQARMNKDMGERISGWVDTPVDINNFDVRLLKKPTNYAMFAIWIVTTKIGGIKALKPVEVFNYLKRKHTSVPVTQKSIARALTRPYNASIFEKTSDGSYYLTPEAERKVAAWIQGAQVDDTPEPEGVHEEEGDEE